jgi:hypothetical protein
MTARRYKAAPPKINCPKTDKCPKLTGYINLYQDQAGYIDLLP